MDYVFLKAAHVICAALSYTLFFVRGVWMIRSSPLLARRWVRIAPHVIDTVLLASAIAMLVLLSVNPFSTPWLAAKLVGLVAYIALGMVALRRGRTRGGRIAAWVAAQAVFFYMVAVALTKSSLPLLP
ncbi:MAG: SirB2 family protein [Betaproteobacteria bacterium]|nr:SirB2 family protein [Betaproteobacteria bacterium]